MLTTPRKVIGVLLAAILTVLLLAACDQTASQAGTGYKVDFTKHCPTTEDPSTWVRIRVENTSTQGLQFMSYGDQDWWVTVPAGEYRLIQWNDGMNDPWTWVRREGVTDSYHHQGFDPC
jgi:hypothetical protein